MTANRVFGFLALCEATSNNAETNRPTIEGLFTEVVSEHHPAYLKATVYSSLSRVDIISSLFLRVLDGSTGDITDQLDLGELLPLASHDLPMDLQLDFPFLVRAPGVFQLVLVANSEVVAMTMFTARSVLPISLPCLDTDQ